MNPIVDPFIEVAPGRASAGESGGGLPHKIGRFEVVEEIGKGSMGAVYLARDPMIGRWVAVKKLAGIQGKDLDPEMVRRLLIHEARNVGALEHPGIVTVFDIVADRSGKVEALAMEFVGGNSLLQRLDDREPISLKNISEIISAVAEALDYAHERGCIHRDVKPANILLGHDGAIKIADFGIAALRGEDLASELRNLGTPNYLAPERVMGQPGDQSTDIYSLGVILYELLTRRLPFEADTIGELVQKIVQEEPASPAQSLPGMTPELEAILARAMAKEPGDRFPTAGALAAAVRKVVQAREAMNDTVPTPPEALGTAAFEQPAIEPSSDPLELLSPLPAELETPFTEPSGADEVAAEEVEWHTAVVAPPEAPIFPETGAAGALAVAWSNASARIRSAGQTGLGVLTSTAATLSSQGRRALGALRSPFALVGLATFALALPMLVWALGDGTSAQSAAPTDRDGVARARRQAIRLLIESRALHEAGEHREAVAIQHQADLLFPVDPEPGMSRRLLVAEREVVRLDRIDEATARARLAVRKADFGQANAAIAELERLEAPVETVLAIETSLDRRRAALRQAARARASEPVKVAAAPIPRVQARRPPPPAPPPATGPGRLAIEFATARARGVLVVFAGEEQVLNRPYRFVEKKNFLVRKGVGGSFVETLELPAGTTDLRIYVSQPRRPTQFRPLRVPIRSAKTTRLRLSVQKDGKLAVAAP